MKKCFVYVIRKYPKANKYVINLKKGHNIIKRAGIN